MITMITTWCSLFRLRLASIFFLISCLGSVAIGQVWVTHVTNPLEVPVRFGLLVPSLAAVAVAIGSVGPRAALPDPDRVRVARLSWFVTLTVVAFLALLPTAVLGAGSVPTILRAVLALTAGAMLPVILRVPSISWLPPSLYTFAALQFGGTGHERYASWAQLLNPEASAQGVLVAFALWLLAAAGYALRRPVAAR